jgi:hypothetical protein
MLELNIMMDVIGAVRQKIVFNDDFDMPTDEVIEKMKSGDILTSIGHGENMGNVYLIVGDDLKKIGKVVEQEACNGLKITVSDDFEDFYESPSSYDEDED